MFADESILAKIKGYKVLLICYDGDTSRVATSVLRAKGIEADSVKEGSGRLMELMATESEKARCSRKDSVTQSENVSEDESPDGEKVTERTVVE